MRRHRREQQCVRRGTNQYRIDEAHFQAAWNEAVRSKDEKLMSKM